MTTFRTTLRRLATEQDGAERLRLSDLLASELEVAFNRQGNPTQVALSNTEEVVLTKIDRLNAQVGDSNTLLSTFLEKFPSQLAAVQADIRAAVAEETARGLGKLSADIDALKASQLTLGKRLDSKRERLDDHERQLAHQQREIAELKQIVAARPAQRQSEQAALVEAIIERLEARENGKG